MYTNSLQLKLIEGEQLGLQKGRKQCKENGCMPWSYLAINNCIKAQGARRGRCRDNQEGEEAPDPSEAAG